MAAPLVRDYEIRVSARARHVRLVVVPGGRLSVVIPRGFSPTRVPDLVARNRAWIERARRRLAGSAEPGKTPERPAQLELRALEECWLIEYKLQPGRSVVAVRGDRLVVSHSDPSDVGLRDTLQRYLHRRARKELAPRLLAMAEHYGVTVEKVAIRAQRTRWASCSASGTISLNRHLLFLPSELVDYVFVHELCHRLELNHSPRFWRLLETAVPSSESLRSELQQAWRYVPEWLSI